MAESTKIKPAEGRTGFGESAPKPARKSRVVSHRPGFSELPEHLPGKPAGRPRGGRAEKPAKTRPGKSGG